MRVLLGFLLLGFALTVTARVTFETSARPSSSWSQGAKAAPFYSVHLIFALKQQNLDQLTQIFHAVSDPKSAQYAETTATVLRFLEGFPVSSINAFNDYIEVDCSVEVAEAMLQTQFHLFTHVKGHTVIRAASPYSLPDQIAVHVDLVAGVTNFPSVRKQKVAEKAQADKALQWGLAVDPAFLRELYKIGSVEGKAKNNSQSIVQFLGQYYSQTDLDEFFLLFYRGAYGNAPAIVGPDNGLPGTEANLDTQYIMAVGAQVPTTFWSNAAMNGDQEGFLQWLLDVAKNPNPPLVFSVSYGDDEDSVTLDYVTRCDTEFMKAGTRGLSILFASGDDGVGQGGRGCKKFTPNWPASSAYITAVGGTAMDGILENGNEVTASLSGGGFSNYFNRPTYQANAVSNYLKTMASKLPDQTKWNSTGRAYPDVAAQAFNFIIVQNLIPLPGVAGTSCAAPTFSGVVSLLNDLRLQNGKPPLGFLNPILYQIATDHPTVFTDIVKGSNPGCGTVGFQAAKGWDPATGLGSPVYSEFAKYILQY